MLSSTLKLLALGALFAGATAVPVFAQQGEAPDLARGEQLFALCAQCHGSAGEGNEEYLAPAIAGLADWYVLSQLESFRGGLRGEHPGDVGGMRMRPMSLWLSDDADVANVAAYVANLPPHKTERTLAGDPEAGKALYAPCTACHAVDGAGNPPLHGAPINEYSSDWYLYTQLSNFKAGIRGTNPKDQWGAMMRPMAMTLANDQAMKDVIAYIMTLSGPQQDGQ